MKEKVKDMYIYTFRDLSNNKKKDINQRGLGLLQAAEHLSVSKVVGTLPILLSTKTYSSVPC